MSIELAAQGSRLDKRLWTGIAGLLGAQGNSTSLVGTAEQVAEALLDYYDLGITTFLIRGFDPLNGKRLIPLTRHPLAKRIHRPLQVAQEVRIDQPQIHHRLEILERHHRQLLAVRTAFQQRPWHQALIGQGALQPGAETAAVRVEDPAVLVHIGQLARLFRLRRIPDHEHPHRHQRARCRAGAACA